MPQIISIARIEEGLRVVTTSWGTLDLTSRDIPGNIRNQSAAVIQAWINDEIHRRLLQVRVCKVVEDPADPAFGQTHCSFYFKVKVHQASPLVIDGKVSDIPIPDDWWERDYPTDPGPGGGGGGGGGDPGSGTGG